ncbi:MAG: hypothetical protein H7A51_18800 [Akkermansiaceae bacterium]|nr:hypothetical protein [Akkermansiaceae bacterium]
MPTKSYIDPDWKASFEKSGFPDFQAWWDTEGELVEEGNFRGKDDNTSWSHVCRIRLDDGRVVYLKRQQNHYPNNVILKLRRIPTFELEWRNYNRLQKAGVPTMKIIYFASRKHNGSRQCIVVSEEVKGMSDIDQLVAWCVKNKQWPPRHQRYALLDAVLKILKKTHSAGIIHNALYGRHIYLNITYVDGSPVLPGKFDACFIDLERTKYPGVRSKKMIYNDLKTMFRYIPEWPTRDTVWFLKKYLGITRLTPEAKAIVRDLAPTRKKHRTFE